MKLNYFILSIALLLLLGIIQSNPLFSQNNKNLALKNPPKKTVKSWFFHPKVHEFTITDSEINTITSFPFDYNDCVRSGKWEEDSYCVNAAGQEVCTRPASLNLFFDGSAIVREVQVQWCPNAECDYEVERTSLMNCITVNIWRNTPVSGSYAETFYLDCENPTLKVWYSHITRIEFEAGCFGPLYSALGRDCPYQELDSWEPNPWAYVNVPNMS